MHIEHILLLEDNREFTETVLKALKVLGYSADAVEKVRDARERLRSSSYDLVLSDVNLPDGTGIDLLREVHREKGAPIFVMMSGHATLETAIEAMRFGATDYLIKPFGPDQLEVALKKVEAWERLSAENTYFRNQAMTEASDGGMVGNSQVMRDLKKLIQQVGTTNATVLILGESGSGKEVVAQAIVAASVRRSRPYIKLNCAAIPENLIESEFFGHEKGAFTGATSKRTGRFEMADGGTLLLDEVTEIPLALQAKLLRVLQEREFERVGGSRTIPIDVRILAATNHDLKAAVKEGRFREDLYYRLNVVPVQVPPLRARPGDIDLLVDHFLAKFSKRHGKPIPVIPPETSEALRRAPWPGNVREIQNCLERAVILSQPSIPLASSDFGLMDQAKAQGQVLEGEEDFSLERMECRLIKNALQKTSGNVTHAAKLLGISTRTLHYKISEKGKEKKDEGFFL